MSPHVGAIALGAAFSVFPSTCDWKSGKRRQHAQSWIADEPVQPSSCAEGLVAYGPPQI